MLIPLGHLNSTNSGGSWGESHSPAFLWLTQTHRPGAAYCQGEGDGQKTPQSPCSALSVCNVSTELIASGGPIYIALEYIECRVYVQYIV